VFLGQPCSVEVTSTAVRYRYAPSMSASPCIGFALSELRCRKVDRIESARVRDHFIVLGEAQHTYRISECPLRVNSDRIAMFSRCRLILRLRTYYCAAANDEKGHEWM
jgi:flavin reductase (DIM6/NTAB) family NADH-FMN oxidoreductase RutF